MTGGLLRVDGLGKRFVLRLLGDKQIEACREVSFSVAPGELVALTGPSGAGKSTVLKCVYRTYLPSAGRVLFASAAGEAVDLAAAPERTVLDLRGAEIGYVSQFLRVIPRVPAREVVMQPLLSRGVAAPEARERAEAVLRRLHIPRALLDAYPATFSGGEQQRINIARAVVWAPRLLLLDEPTASLDAGSAEAALGLLRELRRQGTAMVGVFHDRLLVEATADREVRLRAPGGASDA